MDQPNQETEFERLVHLLTSLSLSNAFQNPGSKLIAIPSCIPENALISPSRPFRGSGILKNPDFAFQNPESELIEIPSCIPENALISPSRPFRGSGILKNPNFAFQNLESELIEIPSGIPENALISPSRPFRGSGILKNPNFGNQEEVCHAVAQKQSPLDKRAEAAVDACLYGIYFMEKTYKKARNEHNNDEVQIKLDELDRIKKYLNNLKGADLKGLNEVRTKLLDLLQHAERISKAEKEGNASAQMNTPLHQASQAEGVDWSHIPQITQRASESAHQEETRRVDAFMQLPMVRNVLSTGVDRNLVRYAIEGMLRETGTMFRDGEALMNAVLNFEQSREVVNTSFFDREPHRNASRSRSQNPDLETENSKLRQCNVCLVADACIHFRPCGHLCCCEACANRVNTCPLCRANIHEKLKTYFC